MARSSDVWAVRSAAGSGQNEMEGAAHYLPSYAGNLDIMTSAALACGDMMARRRLAAGIARGHQETV
jgi:acetaldehyde dehydrogenase